MSTQDNNLETLAKLNQAEAKLDAQEHADGLLDFDAARREHAQQDRAALCVKFGGEFFELPAEAPFSFRVFVLEHCISRQDGHSVFELPDDRVIQFLRGILGTELFAAVSASSVSFDFAVGCIARPILSRWMPELSIDVAPETAPAGESSTPEGKTRESSSGDGQPSKPTSSVATDSTSTEKPSVDG